MGITKMQLKRGDSPGEFNNSQDKVCWMVAGIRGNVKLLSRFFKCFHFLYLLQNRISLLMSASPCTMLGSACSWMCSVADEVTSQSLNSSLVTPRLLIRNILVAKSKGLFALCLARDHPQHLISVITLFLQILLSFLSGQYAFLALVLCLLSLYPL